MWMMGYCSDGGDSFSNRKLRTLMPRPSATPTPLNNVPPCLGRIHAASSDPLLSFNHHLATMTPEQQQQQQQQSNNKVRELSGHQQQQQVVVSSRWNPTPEQLQTLEELYRRGTRTPSAEQIQQITAQLRRYGKIEGKNVFYWFQNHKARERQKRRRQLESSSHDQPQPHTTMENTDNIIKESAGANTGTGLLEVERIKNWSSPTNCSSTLPQEKNTVSMQRAVKATIPECRAEGGWLHFDDNISQQRKSLEEERNTTWQMMEFLGSSNPPTTLRRISSNNYNKQIKPVHNLNIFLSTPPYLHQEQEQDQDQDIMVGQEEEEDDDDDDVDHDVRRRRWGSTNTSSDCHSQTLQLFPLQSSQEIHSENGGEKLETTVEISLTPTPLSPPHKFFEFLPLKN